MIPVRRKVVLLRLNGISVSAAVHMHSVQDAECSLDKDRQKMLATIEALKGAALSLQELQKQIPLGFTIWTRYEWWIMRDAEWVSCPSKMVYFERRCLYLPSCPTKDNKGKITTWMAEKVSSSLLSLLEHHIWGLIYSIIVTTVLEYLWLLWFTQYLPFFISWTVRPISAFVRFRLKYIIFEIIVF